MFDTVLPADSVEFCPHPDALNILACGTYKLDDSEFSGNHQKRHGQCLVFNVHPEQYDELQGEYTLQVAFVSAIWSTHRLVQPENAGA
jgi:diphthamide biosynthesis protein 7